MTELPYRPEHVADAIANSEELTNEELGAFVRLQRAMWRAGGYLPDDPKLLARFARAGKRWGVISTAIMAKLAVADGRVSCPELLLGLLLARDRHSAAVEKATRAIRKRWSQPVDNTAIRSHPKYEFEGRLNSSKPLKVNDPAILGVSSKYSNQNQNNIDLILSGENNAAGGRANAAQAMSETLFQEGVELLCARTGIRRLSARSQIAKWLAAVGAEEPLANILAAADAENLRGPQFVAVIDQRVGAIEREMKFGKPLPLDAGAPRLLEGGLKDG